MYHTTFRNPVRICAITKKSDVPCVAPLTATTGQRHVSISRVAQGRGPLSP